MKAGEGHQWSESWREGEHAKLLSWCGLVNGVDALLAVDLLN